MPILTTDTTALTADMTEIVDLGDVNAQLATIAANVEAIQELGENTPDVL